MFVNLYFHTTPYSFIALLMYNPYFIPFSITLLPTHTHPSPQGGSITSAKSITTDTLEVTHKAVFGGHGKEGAGSGAGAGVTFIGPAVFQGNVEVSIHQLYYPYHP